MEKLNRYNQILFAIILTGGILLAIGAGITMTISSFLRSTAERGVFVDEKMHDQSQKEIEKQKIITVSEPYFYSKSDKRFLLAEIEIKKSTGGSGFYISKGKSWSGGKALYFRAYGNYLTGCSNCWFRNLILFQDAMTNGRKLYRDSVLITRFYLPDPESNLLLKDSTLSEAKKNTLSNLVLYSVIEKDTNDDGLLNDLDNERTYLSDLAFSKKILLTPMGTKLLDWSIDHQGDSLFLYVKYDTNKNGKFDELDKRSVLITSLQKPTTAKPITGF